MTFYQELKEAPRNFKVTEKLSGHEFLVCGHDANSVLNKSPIPSKFFVVGLGWINTEVLAADFEQSKVA